jgi:hypothetical protein
MLHVKGVASEELGASLVSPRDTLSALRNEHTNDTISPTNELQQKLARRRNLNNESSAEIGAVAAVRKTWNADKELGGSSQVRKRRATLDKLAQSKSVVRPLTTAEIAQKQRGETIRSQRQKEEIHAEGASGVGAYGSGFGMKHERKVLLSPISPNSLDKDQGQVEGSSPDRDQGQMLLSSRSTAYIRQHARPLPLLLDGELFTGSDPMPSRGTPASEGGGGGEAGKEEGQEEQRQDGQQQEEQRQEEEEGQEGQQHQQQQHEGKGNEVHGEEQNQKRQPEERLEDKAEDGLTEGKAEDGLTELQRKLARRRTLNNESSLAVAAVRKQVDIERELCGSSHVHAMRASLNRCLAESKGVVTPLTTAEIAQKQREEALRSQKQTKEILHASGGGQDSLFPGIVVYSACCVMPKCLHLARNSTPRLVS